MGPSLGLFEPRGTVFGGWCAGSTSGGQSRVWDCPVPNFDNRKLLTKCPDPVSVVLWTLEAAAAGAVLVWFSKFPRGYCYGIKTIVRMV